jgi:hypothetical protein
MPIVDASIVIPTGESLPEGAAQLLADTISVVLGAEPGQVWVRVQPLPLGCYAENSSEEVVHPVFLKVLHAELPATDALEAEAAALSRAVGERLGRPSELIHIEYAAPGKGRVAFGGRLLT